MFRRLFLLSAFSLLALLPAFAGRPDGAPRAVAGLPAGPMSAFADVVPPEIASRHAAATGPVRSTSATQDGWRVRLLQFQEWDYDISDWVDWERDSSVYDAQGRIVSMTARWVQEGVWVDYYRFLYLYDDNGNLTTFLSQSGSGAGWVNYVQYAYTYDGANNQTSFTRIKWFQGAWQNQYRWSYSYDGAGNQIKYLHQLWGGAYWIGIDQNFSGYDSAAHRIETVYQLWADTIWVNTQRDTMTYDGQGHRSAATTQMWNTGGKIWQNYMKVSYTYNSYGDTTLHLVRTWGDSTWWNSSRIVWTYDPQGHLLQVDEQVAAPGWQDGTRETYTYDPRWNQTAYTQLLWNGAYWVNQIRYLSAYDANDQRTSLRAQRYDGVEWLDKSLNEFTWDGNGNLASETRQIWAEYYWTYIARYVYSYDFASAVGEAPGLPLQASLAANYPNPFNPSTTIGFTLNDAREVDLRVYDLLGRTVATLLAGRREAGAHTVVWYAAGVPSGVYVYRLTAGGFTEARKMLLLR